MDRKEFLALVGTSIGAIVLGNCLQGCKKQNPDMTPKGPTVDFTLDLNSGSCSALKNNGGYMYANEVIVARTSTGNYIAVAQACTHQGTAVVYKPSANDFYCLNHGSVFAPDGTVTTGPASVPLKQYTTTLNGSTLRING